jgi:hypothetical protein
MLGTVFGDVVSMAPTRTCTPPSLKHPSMDLTLLGLGQSVQRWPMLSQLLQVSSLRGRLGAVACNALERVGDGKVGRLNWE